MRKLALCMTIALAACGKSGDKQPGDPPADKPAAGPRDGVIAAWKAAQLVPTLAPAAVGFGKDCQAGTVSGLDLVVCNFATPAEAKAAEGPALAWVGGVTGAAQAHGAALVVIADRKQADPSGKTINRLMKLAPN
ncbi:MAG TPA: hypothetical protein VGC42_18290 [Kofleriaceae bacterium]